MSAGWCQYTAEEEESLFTAMSIGLNSRTGQLDTSSAPQVELAFF